MKRKFKLSIICCVLVTVFLAGCGRWLSDEEEFMQEAQEFIKYMEQRDHEQYQIKALGSYKIDRVEKDVDGINVIGVVDHHWFLVVSPVRNPNEEFHVYEKTLGYEGETLLVVDDLKDRREKSYLSISEYRRYQGWFDIEIHKTFK